MANVQDQLRGECVSAASAMFKEAARRYPEVLMDRVTVAVIGIGQHMKALTLALNCDPNCDLFQTLEEEESARSNFTVNGCLGVLRLLLQDRLSLLLPKMIEAIRIDAFFKSGVPLEGSI